jgi:hypothetical protein
MQILIKYCSICLSLSLSLSLPFLTFQKVNSSKTSGYLQNSAVQHFINSVTFLFLHGIVKLSTCSNFFVLFNIWIISRVCKLQEFIYLLFIVTFPTKTANPQNSFLYDSETQASIIINLTLLVTKLSLNKITF